MAAGSMQMSEVKIIFGPTLFEWNIQNNKKDFFFFYLKSRGRRVEHEARSQTLPDFL